MTPRIRQLLASWHARMDRAAFITLPSYCSACPKRG